MATPYDQRANALCEGLLRDLRTNCRRSAEAIALHKARYLQFHRRQAIESLAQIEVGVAEALKAPAESGADLPGLGELGAPYDVFRRTQLPFFAHYGPNERYLTRLAVLLSEQAGFATTPLVGTFSGTGFWTNPELRMICVPAGEHAGLLGIPDLVHELAHMLIHELGGELRVGMLRDIIVPYTQGIADEELGRRLYRQYQLWQIEFIADAIATYVCGPSYGWQHIRLNAQRGALTARQFREPWFPDAPDEYPERYTHPADTARTTVIAKALGASTQKQEAKALLARWRTLTATAGAAPASYAQTYPDALLAELVKMTLAWCKSIGIVPFTRAPAGAIARRVDEAWTEQLADPVKFEKSESASVSELAKLLAKQVP